MQITMPRDTWAEWSTANPDAPDADKLAALREIIGRTAREWVHNGDIGAAWANKKLTSLGITDLISIRNEYVMTVPVTGVMKLAVSATSREEARKQLQGMDRGSHTLMVSEAIVQGDPTFVSGPEDPTGEASPDAPVTVQATLDKLREIILLGNIAGPRFDCDSGASAVLATYGLPPVPARQEYVVVRPVSAAMRTVVEAYDEASAQRVADWRWENNQAGYSLTEPVPSGVASVEPA